MIAFTSVPRLKPRDPESHKGTYGRVLVVAGSTGMSGAAVLTGSAALRGGAGLVTVACPESIQLIVAIGNPCYTTRGYLQVHDLFEAADRADVLAIGPGLGQSPEAAAVVRQLLDRYRSKPIVLDADGLNNLPMGGELFRNRSLPAVLTPHPGEFARLLGSSLAEIPTQRETLAGDYARSHEVVLLLKGHHTLVTDGHHHYTNRTGNPGMATGGSGDVLTGVIAALMAQDLSPFDAACLGAHVHGRAGDLAATAIGPISLIASDLLTFLGPAFQEVACENGSASSSPARSS